MWIRGSLRFNSYKHKHRTPTTRQAPQRFPMATLFSPSALFSPSTNTTTTTSSSSSSSPHKPLLKPAHLPPPKLLSSSSSSSLAATTAALLLLSSPPALASLEPAFHLYYGTASSAANYGGFGGNEDKKATAEYTYEVPDGWKERLVSKVEKGTNGTDSEFYNPKKRSEREYLTFLYGFPGLAPMDAVLNNLALSDVGLQDLIASADGVKSEEKKDGKGQVYYAYEIDGADAHSLISVTCSRNKLFAHFVRAPNPEWQRDKDTLRHLHESFKTVDAS